MPKKNKGYYGHSAEHSLNARGVLTSKSHFVVNHHNYDVDVTSVKPGLVDVCVYRNGEEIMKTRMEPLKVAGFVRDLKKSAGSNFQKEVEVLVGK
jgi:hypothetical protein